MGLTKEQQYVIDTLLSSDDGRIVAVNSVAGSGKSSTARALVEVYKPKNGFLFAFNKAIIEDTKKKMGGLINCSTIHSLAHKHIRPKKIEELTYQTITEPISYEDKATVISILDDFFRSSSDNIHDFAKARCHEDVLCDLIAQYADKMLEGKIPVTFNYMLKCLHLLLLNGQIQLDFDLLILDECQDTTKVALEIFKLVNADHKIMFGDKYQNIYSFMNTVNAFEELSDLHLLKLTKSFRCNPEIANIVEEYGDSYLETGFSFKGNEAITKATKTEIAYITRTNSALIERMQYLLDRNQSFSLTRNVDEIFALPIALLNASRGRPVYDKRYKYLEKEYANFEKVRSSYRNYFDYILMTTQDQSLENTAKVLASFANKRINIYDVKERVANMKPNKSVILTTAHAFKGLEMDTVYIEDDLNNSVNRVIEKIKSMEPSANISDIFRRARNMDIVDAINSFNTPHSPLTREQREDLNTYYVGISRAKSTLINQKYFH